VLPAEARLPGQKVLLVREAPLRSTFFFWDGKNRTARLLNVGVMSACRLRSMHFIASSPSPLILAATAGGLLQDHPVKQRQQAARDPAELHRAIYLLGQDDMES
jgi:hypothetical protein